MSPTPSTTTTSISSLVKSLLDSNTYNSHSLMFSADQLGFASNIKSSITPVLFYGISQGVIINLNISYTIPVQAFGLAFFTDFLNSIALSQIPYAKNPLNQEVKSNRSADGQFYYISVSYSSNEIPKDDYLNKNGSYTELINALVDIINISIQFVSDSITYPIIA